MTSQQRVAWQRPSLVNIRELCVSSDVDINVVSLVMLKAVVLAARELGIAVSAEDVAHVDFDKIVDPSQGIPRQLFGDILLRLAHRAADFNQAHFHFVGPLVMSGVDARRAIELFLQARRSVLGGPGWRLTVSDQLARLGHPAWNASEAARIEAELGMSIAYAAAQHFLGRSARPSIAVEFAFPAPGDLRPYHAYFGPRVSFGAASNNLVFPECLLDQVRPAADPELSSLLAAYAHDRYLRVRKTDSWTELVRHTLTRVGSMAELDVEAVAATWRISARTLRRKLEGEGTSFSAIREQVRLERAAELLQSGPSRIDEIAKLLGYTEVNSFRRAFKRWSGRTPSSFRLGD